MQQMPGWEETFFEDGLHFSPAGNAAFYKLFQELIDRELPELRWVLDNLGACLLWPLFDVCVCSLVPSSWSLHVFFLVRLTSGLCMSRVESIPFDFPHHTMLTEAADVLEVFNKWQRS